MIGRFFRSDLPLGKDVSTRFLPWIIGAMVYLAALAVAGTLAMGQITGGWRAEIAGELTVELPPPETAAEGGRAERLDATVALLIADPSIAGARIVGPDEMQRLIEPWLGPDFAVADLPLPDLIAVTLRDAATPDLEALQAQLDLVVPGARLDDHREWRAELMKMTNLLRGLALLIVALVAGAGAVAVTFVTRTGLDIHRTVIEVVHLLGARDLYIARQFQRHALWLGLMGGALGLAGGAATVVGLGWIAGQGGGLLPPIAFTLWDWALIALLPVAAGLIAMATARLTVMAALRQRY